MREMGGSNVASDNQSIGTRLAQRATRAVGRLVVRVRIDLRVEGIEHVPRHGPAIIAAHHFHHLYDGCAVFAALARPADFVIALDWVPAGRRRDFMIWSCRAIGWPWILRTSHLCLRPGECPDAGARERVLADARRRLAQATREVVALLRAGHLFALFPEGYANVDPGFTPKHGDAEFLPFQPGFIRFAELAEKDGVTRVPIIPAGVRYERGRRWQIVMRFGPPVYVNNGVPREELLRRVEEEVRRLSLAPEQVRAAEPDVAAV